jgi:hypothetical protein
MSAELVKPRGVAAVLHAVMDGLNQAVGWQVLGRGPNAHWAEGTRILFGQAFILATRHGRVPGRGSNFDNFWLGRPLKV